MIKKFYGILFEARESGLKKLLRNENINIYNIALKCKHLLQAKCNYHTH